MWSDWEYRAEHDAIIARKRRNRRKVRARTLYKEFRDGKSVSDIAYKRDILTSDVEKAIRTCIDADAGEE